MEENESKPRSVRITDSEFSEVEKASKKSNVKAHKFMKDAILSKAKRVNSK